ncbi:MFS transporter [Patulibacter defluvii]|uniref:MFS transporter n=1 Tax=Patulibacter defluvii TaxID=3095358 RepID=UPI002A75F3B4|nr:MFS transporter [Patulibacter sp. DM4]
MSASAPSPSRRWSPAALTPATTIGAAFWPVFAASLLSCLANGASTPVLPLFVREELGGSATTVGLVVGAGPIVAVVLRPVVGVLADRWGRRRVTIAGAVISVVGMGVLLVAASAVGGAAGRVLHGIGGAAINLGTMAWLVDTALRHARGRVLSIFGLSIWIGLALGPPLGETLRHELGFSAVWTACALLSAAALLCVVPLREPPRPEADHGARPGAWRDVLRPVARPAGVAAIAFAGESVILTFLVLHLRGEGLPEGGVTGAASVYTIFAASVIAARVLLGGLPDRMGPTRTATASLVLLALGLAVLGLASTWGVAALGAALVGFGFSPLYPSLVMLATDGLHPAQRAAGIGVFAGCIDLGIALGALLGGVIAAHWDEGAVFGAAALVQLAGLVLLRRGGDAPRPPAGPPVAAPPLPPVSDPAAAPG